MEINAVTIQQLYEVMQYVNLVKLMPLSGDVWVIATVMYSDGDSINIFLNQLENRYNVSIGDEVIVKFQRQSYEYLVSGEIIGNSEGHPRVVTISAKLVQKYYNQRKYHRFDTDLSAVIKTRGKKNMKSRAKNISRGGALIISDMDIETDNQINIQINFDSGNKFRTSARIMRKSSYGEGMFGYGVQFIDTNPLNIKIINNELSIYEKQYLKSLSIFREHENTAAATINTKIAIFNYDIDDSYAVREELIKLGADNFEAYQNFKFSVDFFTEEKPEAVIIDCGWLNQDAHEVILELSRSFPWIKVVLLVPLKLESGSDLGTLVPDSVKVLYKPLIFKEFQDEIIKYL